MIRCQNMVYINRIVHMLLNGVSTSLDSSVFKVTERDDDMLDVITVSGEHYVVDFSTDRLKRYFINRFEDATNEQNNKRFTSK